MSIATELTRLQEDRNTIRNKFVNLGIAESTANLSDLATAAQGIANRGAPNAQVTEGEAYTIQAGYYSGGSVQGVKGGGNYSLQAKSVTPTKEQQAVSPDAGYYGLSGVTVAAIPEAYQDVTNVTATAADVLANKVIVTADGTTTAGTMPNNGAISKTLDANTTQYTVPSGYHNGSGLVKVVTETKSTTPTTSSQTISATTGKLLTSVTVNAIPAIYGDATNADADAGDILVDKKAVVDVEGVATLVEGTMPNNGAVSKSLNTTTTSYTVPSGYHNGNGTVTITLETKSATPTTSAQDITPTAGKVLSKVTVNKIPVIYGNATNATATASQILAGAKAVLNNNGTATLTEGTMTNNGAVSGSIDGLSVLSFTVPSGYTTGGTVSLTNDIETALAAI